MIDIRNAGQLLIVFLLLGGSLLPLSLSAQSQSGGSTYSIFNIGDLQSSITAAGAGRAGVETAIAYSDLLNSVNPAAWTTLNYVTIQAGLRFEQYRVSDADQSIWQNRTAFQNITVGIPFSEKLGGAIGLGIRPYTTVNYRTGHPREVPSGDTTVTADITYSGSGGVSQGFIGASINPFDKVALGATLDLYFGSSDHRSIVDFPGSTLNDAGYVNTDSWSGIGGTIGLFITPTKNVTIGATFTPGFTLTDKRESLSIFREGGIDDTVSVTESESELLIPGRISFGASLKSGRTLLSGDLIMQAWGGHDQLSETRNRLRAGIGLDYLPARGPIASGFSKWTWRTGLWYERTYYALSQGDIDEMGLAFGAHIPFSATGRLGSGAGADIGVELGTRGTIDNGLTRELFGKFSLELSINEFWFSR